MCGTLKFENQTKKIGDRVDVIVPSKGLKRVAEWGGFAKSEYLKWWMERGAEPVVVKVDSFIEGTTELKVENSALVGIIIRKDIYSKDRKLVGRSGMVRIVTREPKNCFEKDIHSRWPEAVPSKGEKPQIYTEEHVLNADDS